MSCPNILRVSGKLLSKTEQLLVDEAQLTLAEFKRTSTELGFAQSDLKQNTASMWVMNLKALPYIIWSLDLLIKLKKGLTTPTLTMKMARIKSMLQQLNNTSIKQHHSSTKTSLAPSDLIAQYGHNHGEAELGFVGFKGPSQPPLH